MSKVADCSFVHFVYPFLFDPAGFRERVARLDEATCDSNTRAAEALKMWVPLWKEKGFPRDDMLAYVAGFLNPKDPDKATARVWKLNDRLDEVGAGSSSLFAVQLALFRVGVCLLTVRASPESDEVSDWLEFVSNFRFVKGQRQLTVRATKVSRDAETGEVKPRDFFPPPAAARRELREEAAGADGG